MNDKNTVTLTRPIVRGKESITWVTITEAMSQPGCLRGLKLYDVLQSDVDSMFKLLPRVTSPVLTEVELVTMSSHDFTNLVTTAVTFLAPPLAPSPTA
ncbi:phage tail assembly protein [Serratia marcescens]|uniref:phage tail assembly protein n=1 Tax=Serratia marcescens TaxID=615 RepID=UPI0024C4D97E|nr:phage tail assembly protein [Serratia marcescens]MDK1707001.1 phage tail assembly protein [Serratia marcescens]